MAAAKRPGKQRNPAPGSPSAVEGRPAIDAAHSPHETYENPLVTRYASAEMVRIFSSQNRARTWRRIWLAIAEAEHELGLPVSKAQVAALRGVLDRIDFEAISRHEERTRHDVMAHIHALGEVAPAARAIIHLGATSMDVVDNADLILMRDALELLFGRLIAAANNLATFCDHYADLPTLGYTHLQPAPLTTVGKRATLWLYDLMRDIQAVRAVCDGLPCRGLRGATGTQASFLKLLGSPAKVAKLEQHFAEKLGFRACVPVCGQTYTRKIDLDVAAVLASLAASVHKSCNDIRLLSMLKEIDEPFEKSQVGSSAMPYKRNPALCERATGLSRFLLSLASSPPMTLAAQMFERTLDDSSNKRLVIPEAFLTADALAILIYHIFDGLVVYPATITAHVSAELPFIATEEILMEAAAGGGDRQHLHERLREHTHAVANAWKNPDLRSLPKHEGTVVMTGEEYQARLHEALSENPGRSLIGRLQADRQFANLDWERLLDPTRHVGLAVQQTNAFLKQHVTPVLKKWARRAVEPPRLAV